MGCNPCCCFTLKDGAITIGIWTLIYSIASIFLFGWQTSVLNSCHTVTMSQANLQCEYSCPCVGASNARTAAIIEAQLGIMGWQMAAIKYERDRAANTLLPNYNTYGRFDFPSYYESYWQSPEERYYTGLFVIQILCLIAAFFLLFASVALIYGIHTWSRYLVWPWFPCVISSVLCSLAYCIMWWAGDVRSYWMAITIIEIIGVFINIYCVVVVLMYYRRVTATTDEYDGKTEGVTYNINKNGYGYDKRDHLRPIEYRKKNVDTVRPYRTEYMTPVPMPSYNPYSPNGTPLPLPPQYSQLPPYPINPNEIKYVVEQKPRHDDPVSNWVRQQTIERAEANSEPVSPSKEVAASFPPMKHARSVPSLFDGTLVSHKDCRHRDNHRNSSKRRRSRSRHRYPSYSSESDSDRDFRRHGDGRRRPRSRSRYAESEISDFTEPRRHSHRHRDSDRHRHDDNRRRNKHEDRRDDDSKGSKRRHGERKKEKNHRGDERQPLNPSTSLDTPPSPTDGIFPLSGGISIPQHIVIPPSNGERGPDGKPLPQKFQINSEITINYDHNQSSPTSEGPPRRYPIHSNV